MQVNAFDAELADRKGHANGLDALPRTGLRLFHLAVVIGDEDEDEDDVYGDLIPLVAAMPASVESLEFEFDTLRDPNDPADLITLTRSLSVATRSLKILYGWLQYAVHFHPFQFVPTLESLVVSGIRAQLMTLLLPMNDLTHADLDVLAPHWPVTLRELNLRFNVYVWGRGDPGKPVDLDKHVQEMVWCAWIELMPTNLRILDLFAVPLSDGMAAGLVERMPVRAPLARMVLFLRYKWASGATVALLKARFVVHVLV
ncbi:hypothetical protein GGF32_004570 [Allomyces javanicus]|nr:hypothetical protein GGF32_004570 [Allomyces javanicus]